MRSIQRTRLVMVCLLFCARSLLSITTANQYFSFLYTICKTIKIKYYLINCHNFFATTRSTHILTNLTIFIHDAVRNQLQMLCCEAKNIGHVAPTSH